MLDFDRLKPRVINIDSVTTIDEYLRTPPVVSTKRVGKCHAAQRRPNKTEAQAGLIVACSRGRANPRHPGSSITGAKRIPITSPEYWQ
jgi:hypothetical protein